MDKAILFWYSIIWLMVAIIFSVIGCKEGAWAFFTAFLITNTLRVVVKD